MKLYSYVFALLLLSWLLFATSHSSYAQYCTPAYNNNCSSNDFINNFTFNTLSNIASGCNGNVNNYINYSPTGTLTTSLEAGASYTISLQSGYFWPQGFGVWIDFNNDADFDDAGEFLYGSPAASIEEFSAAVIIPSSPLNVGSRRMRVRSKFQSILLPDESCTNFNYGETEDYTITITPAITNMAFQSSTVTQTNVKAVGLGEQDAELIGIQVVTNGVLNPIELTSLAINSNGSSDFVNDVTDVKVYFTGTDPEFNTNQLLAQVTDLTAPVTLNTTLASGNNYFWVAYDIAANAMVGDVLDAECTQITMSGTGGTQIPSITAPAGFREVNYCFPTYSNPCTLDYIDIVTLNSLNNVFTGCNGNVNNYIYYPPVGSLTTSLELGGNYTLALQSGQNTQGYGVWIDYNDDLDFDDADEFVFASPNTTTSLVIGTVTIPNITSYLGTHRMRIRSVYNNVLSGGDFCTHFQYGETEDYTISVIPSTTMVYLSSTATQYNTNDVQAGTDDQQIIGVEVVTTGSSNPFALTSLTVNSDGTTNFSNDVSGVKVYFTGTDPGFSTGTLFGASTDLSTPITGTMELVSGVNHFWVAYDVLPTALVGDYLDAECTEIILTGGIGATTPSLTSPFGNRQVGYCSASSTFGCGIYYIDECALNTLSNLNSGCNGNTNGYIKYPPEGSNTTILELGGTYLLHLGGPEFTPLAFGVWIDYNNDGDFDDVDEFVYSSPAITTGSQGGMITIAGSSAYAGERRMRVREKDDNLIFANESCEQFYIGETEDYTISLSLPSGMVYQSATTFQENQYDVLLGENDAEILGIQIVTLGSINPFNVLSFDLDPAGSSNFVGDVTNVKIYTTGSNPEFSTTNLFGSSTDLSTPVTGSVTLNIGNNFFWVTYDIAASATLGDYVDVSCNQLQFSGSTGTQIPAVTSPPGNRQVGYCTSISASGCDIYFIDGVVLNTLSNLQTGCNGSESGYIKYEANQTNTTSLEIGNDYLITLNGPTADAVGFGVWIDFNNDGDFEEAEEFVFASPGYATGTQSGLISIPDNSNFLGERRMRIRTKDFAVVSSTESCLPFSYGETEDYTITLVAAAPMIFTSVTAFQDNLTVVQPGQTNVEIEGLKILTSGSLDPLILTSISFTPGGSTDFNADVSGVKVFYSGSIPDFTTSVLFGTANDLTSPITGSIVLSAGENYFWLAYDLSANAVLGHFVDAACNSITLSGTGGTYVPDITAPYGAREINYCIGMYDFSCISEDYIDNFTFNTLSNLMSGCSGNINNYTNFPASGNLTTAVILGETYDLSVQSGPLWAQGFGVWIDYNNDASFDGADEFVFASPAAGNVVFNGSVTIPNVPSSVGQHRLRVRCVYGTIVTSDDYCNNLNRGETEDYTITIAPQIVCSGTPVPGTLTITPEIFCMPGTVASLVLSDYSTGSGIVFQWEQSTDGSLWNVISGATASTYTTDPLSATTYYRVQLTCTGSGQFAYSNNAVVTLIPVPAAPESGDVQHCGAGNVSLSATGNGGSLNWYDQTTGGNLLATGSTFITPYINATTTFYVEEIVVEDSAGCASLRTPVDAIIYHPDISAGSSLNGICMGENVSLIAQNNGSGIFNFQWTPIMPGMMPSNGQAASVTVPPASSTIFTVTATEINNQCDTAIEVNVIVFSLPDVQISGLNNTYEVMAPAVTLTGTPPGGTFTGPGITGDVFTPATAGVGGPYVIGYKYTDVNGCTASDTVLVTVTFPLGTNYQLPSAMMDIYPNPNNGMCELHVKSSISNQLINCKVMNMVGQALYDETLTMQAGLLNKSFDFSTWAKGTYYFLLNADGQLYRKKLVIQ